ncbi:MAG: hypothetical protein HRU35_04190 [Rickettsiaceae bacterium]|nr:hypothetical protein [Rickettsiaceae bacterium]
MIKRNKINKHRYNVLKFYSPFEKLKENSPKESWLFRAIILQAIIDISTISSDREFLKIQRKARSWFFDKSNYFKFVCFNADLHPDYVIKLARHAVRINRENKLKSQSNNYNLNKSEVAKSNYCQ